MIKTLLLIVILFFETMANAEERTNLNRFEINTELMERTFKIVGKNSEGTGFLIGRPLPDDPKKSITILVTAAHVLDGIQEEIATIVLRQKGQDGKWNTIAFPFQIREASKPLYLRHPTADVAVMYINIPPSILVSTPNFPLDLLADDNLLERFELHPGDKLFCLGFPFGFASNEAGFPILRSGTIASYPLLPTRETKTFLFDFQVFYGNSGGPVYFYDVHRIYKGASNIGEEVHFIMGLVSEQRLATATTKELYGQHEQSYPLGLAVVVHASLIKDIIQRLPLPDPSGK